MMMMSQSERNSEQQSDHIYYTLFSAGAKQRCCYCLLRLLPASQCKTVEITQSQIKKTIILSETGMF
jgi:hypothetical protein